MFYIIVCKYCYQNDIGNSNLYKSYWMNRETDIYSLPI